MGAELVAISPQLSEKSREMIDKKALGFEILRDAGNEVAATFGLRFDLRPDLKEVYLGFGIDLATSNGDNSWTLPMPARYVVAQDSEIHYAAVHPDYTTRPEPTETLAALRGML